jgi:putative oxidoreductase
MKFFNKHKDIGILLLRFGVGAGFLLVHGMMKITGGPDFWTMMGKTMGIFGITFAPGFWGFMNAFVEFGGGALIILGLFTRPAAAFMAFNMLIALSSHLSRLDPWARAIYPIELGSVFLGLIFIGAGKYSLDYIISKRKRSVPLVPERFENVHDVPVTSRQAQA